MILVGAFRAGAAVREALERRMRGERFDVRFALIDDATAVAASVIGSVIANNPAGAQRRAALDALGARTAVVSGRPLRDFSSRIPAERAAAREIATLAQRIIVHSHAEADDVAAFAGVRREKITLVPPPVQPIDLPPPSTRAETIGVARRGVRDDVVALIVHALEDPGEHVIVGSDAAELREARVIVSADPSDPSLALAFAQSGRPLAVAATSGAREYLDGVGVFDSWDPRSIRAAVGRARTAAPPVLRAQPPGASERAPATGTSGPLVSIVVRTRDRPAFLRRALASIAAQTYANVETIVVVDGGVPVDEVLAAFPAARAIVHATPQGPVGAAIAGMHAANGTYLGMLDDDDVLFPDHIERVAGALCASGGHVAHSIATTIFARAEGETYRISGMGTFLRRVARPDRVHLEHGVGPMTVLVRRDAYDEIGGYDPGIGHAEDWDLMIRLTERNDVVFVPEVTAAYTVRPEAADSLVQTGGQRIVAAQMYLMEKYPLANRPRLAEERIALLKRTLASGGTARFPAHVPLDGGVLW